MELDISFVRSQFPAFSEPGLEGWAFFENAGGSYPCRQFIDKLYGFYLKNKVQPYYPYPASMRAGEMMDESYARMAAYLNVSPEEIHFGPSTTQNVYVLAHAMRPMWENGDEVVVSCQDHEANAGTWRRLKERGIIVKEWHVDRETGMLDAGDLDSLLSERTRMVAFPHCSNVIGYFNPVREISNKVKKAGANCVVDGVAAAPHGFPDLSTLGADIYMFSLYKTYGPHLGLMYVDHALIEKMENQSHFFKEGITRSMITPAGPDHAQIGAVSGILDYYDAVYNRHFKAPASPNNRNTALAGLFREHKQKLLDPLLNFLRSREDVKVIGPESTAHRAPTVSILPLKKNLDDVYAGLVKHRLMLGKGDFYAVRPLMDMEIPRSPGVIRMSFLHYNTSEEIEQLIRGLENSL
ncbi:Selenocysteine lyase/Cysteine desulfurase [Muriicola jejuensis]|uniref:Aminotransferase class V-fold PLP-dependent enzyme n=1 Tax=Muriicola jejuensis TaxID=504488 RepID=A0A6P0UFL7_9FLAO|nr:aminotransferase class V-fold PLP-dependent enzyme [Muriicola jejuensis]NER11412.1 aminotransferase class V-fold PLP-dependent enzyme [Muriicola jejuensis]SMP20896.1 Selenocysteine lyase/Cysteine desulfurase [Muriicola jejuensis]